MIENRSSSERYPEASICCHVCGQEFLEQIVGYDTLRLVTSDCKPCHEKGKLHVCVHCGCVQKAVNKHWLKKAKTIYHSYAIYHQSDGEEQMVFENESGIPVHRSERIVNYIDSNARLPSKGRLLDIGCGNGAFMYSFNKKFPNWTLSGTEFDDHHREAVESIPKVQCLYTTPLDTIPEHFNLITLIHVLEHIPNPVSFLNKLRDKISENGKVFIEAPNFLENPFDLLIFDHCTHFTPFTFKRTLKDAGFETVCLSINWIPKEMTFIGKMIKNSIFSQDSPDSEESFTDRAKSAIKWLSLLREEASILSRRGSFGIFGTSIAGTWLYSELSEVVDFFVDEDPYRIGKPYMGLPIYQPKEVSKGSSVYIVLPYKISIDVKNRLEWNFPSVKWFNTPPEIEIDT